MTVPNLIRVVCSVILRGTTNCSDNAQHFRGLSVRTQFSQFKRTGAAEFCGLSLFNFEQIIRFWHLVDSSQRPPKEDDDYDKCYLVRPIIKRGQSAFQRWCTPGRDSGMDEGGLNSRHRWLRKRDPSKPNTYFIELIMLCASKSRFCLDFFINEGQSKNIKRINRRPGQHGYKKVPYKQFEYTDEDHAFALSRGATAGHMQYFARRLRERVGNDGYIYHIHVDKRWGNMMGMVTAMDLHKVAYTCSVKKGARFHVCYDLDMIKSKARANRGKYRSAQTTINGVKINTVLWQDSKLVGFASTYSGTENSPVTRRQGRFQFDIACPKMVVTRSENFRAVDSNDQMRMCDVQFEMICRTKAWPVVNWGITELIILQIFLICRIHPRMTDIAQPAFRWQMLQELLDYAWSLEGRAAPRTTADAGQVVARFHPNSQHLHHHDDMPEYVTASELEALNEIHSTLDGDLPNPKNPRTRDRRGNRKRRRSGSTVVSAWCS